MSAAYSWKARSDSSEMIEVEGPLGRDALRVTVLILHDAQHGGIIEVESSGIRRR